MRGRGSHWIIGGYLIFSIFAPTGTTSAASEERIKEVQTAWRQANPQDNRTWGPSRLSLTHKEDGQIHYASVTGYITDLTPLAGLPLEELALSHSYFDPDAKGWKAVRAMKTLKRVWISQATTYQPVEKVA